jgi:hypothetical protein
MENSIKKPRKKTFVVNYLLETKPDTTYVKYKKLEQEEKIRAHSFADVKEIIRGRHGYKATNIKIEVFKK